MTGARLPRSSLVVAISNMIHDIYARGNVGTYLWYNVDNRMLTTTHLQFVTIEQQINYFTTKTIMTRCLNDLVSTQEWWTLRRYPLIWPVSRITFYDFAEPVRDRLSLEWQSLEIVLALAEFLQLSWFSTTHRESWDAGTAHQFQLRSNFITAVMDWSRGNSQTHLRCLTGAFGVHAYKPADYPNWDNLKKLVNSGKGSNKKIISNGPYHYSLLFSRYLRRLGMAEGE